MEIKNCELSDVDAIIALYQAAIEYQKTKKCAVWPLFDIEDIKLAIAEKRQFKIIIENKMACIFTYTFDDAAIWGSSDCNDAIYIHKIATHPNCKGQNLVEKIIIFSKQQAIDKQKMFLRMDTVGENTGLISYYTKCGFTFLGLRKLTLFSDLPEHYHNATVSLFEMKI
jgi:ribosomal protein S18 acetylase RimI-like enzyme